MLPRPLDTTTRWAVTDRFGLVSVWRASMDGGALPGFNSPVAHAGVEA